MRVMALIKATEERPPRQPGSPSATGNPDNSGAPPSRYPNRLAGLIQAGSSFFIP